MKKLLLAFVFIAAGTFALAAEKYKIDDAAVDQLFNQSKDISSSPDQMLFVNMNQPGSLKAAGDQTVGGFLLRDFFCGFIALHRTYMGGTDLWWKYCLTTVVLADIPGIVDFFWVLLEGDDALSKYKGTDKFLVWL